MRSFSSYMDWETLKIGPETALTPSEREDNDKKTGEEITAVRFLLDNKGNVVDLNQLQKPIISGGVK